MTALLDRSKSLVLLGAATCVLTALTGCGGGSSPAKPQAAKTMYIVNYASDPNDPNNHVETDTVLGYSTTAPGSTTPTTTLNLPTGFETDNIATGPDGKLYVSGNTQSSGSDQILVFAADATGSASPIATITGSTTENNGTFTYAYYMAVNSKNQLFVMSDDYTIEVFAAGATGNATPTQYITWGVNNFSYIYDIATDGLGETFISDYGNNEIYVFAAGATGNAAPVRTITGTNAGTFDSIWSMTADDAGNVYTVNYNYSDDPARNGNVAARPMLASHHAHEHGRHVSAHPHDANPSGSLHTGIIVFPAGATGNATPLRTISGSTTKVFYPAAIAVDAVSNIYYVDDDASTLGPLMMFPPTATGDVAPLLNLSLSNLSDPEWGALALY